VGAFAAAARPPDFGFAAGVGFATGFGFAVRFGFAFAAGAAFAAARRVRAAVVAAVRVADAAGGEVGREGRDGLRAAAMGGPSWPGRATACHPGGRWGNQAAECRGGPPFYFA
jgi:hypothetical protein